MKIEDFKIKRYLGSVKSLVNEIIVVDTGSTDKTKEIALNYYELSSRYNYKKALKP